MIGALLIGDHYSSDEGLTVQYALPIGDQSRPQLTMQNLQDRLAIFDRA